ncbi:hypothetical protein Ade02nite_76570 [Paractinoplanes deccanensis]|uniref:Lipoprotein n=1 Tax=Paractinoplanes deccanensis TaxID=113561 RepID=A0ABQ3YGA4_9ACTN|nr:hypothetical protein [Actinoplanes deccanensis]GID79016.1 hypothetical protein Ade02nite_76570 [Actinoplanes deccanensis]
MSPRTRALPLIIVGSALLSACGSPPQPQPTSPTYATASAAPVPLDPSLLPPVTLPGTPTTPATTFPAYPTTYPTLAPTTLPTVPTTTAPTEKSPTPTPSHAPKCTTGPTAAEILALVKKQEGMGSLPLVVREGPLCASGWSFATLEDSSADEDPLMVVATGAGATLALVAAGSDVCISRVETSAPPGIRVLACGY